MNADSRKPIDIPFIDKLVNEDYEFSHGIGIEKTNISQLRNSVLRDIESLLNTRSQIVLNDVNLQELNQSIATYGLPDFFTHFSNIEDAKLNLCKQIKRCLQQFEPRLFNINVEPDNEIGEAQRFLAVKISAYLHTGMQREDFIINTKMDPSDLSLSVEELHS